MQRVDQVFLLVEEGAPIHPVLVEAENWGLQIHVAANWLALGADIGREPSPAAFALAYQPDSLFLYITSLRRDYPAAGLVVLGARLDELERTHLVWIGADACFSLDTSPAEIVAGLQALRRRARAFGELAVGSSKTRPLASRPARPRPPASDPTGIWHLLEDGWRLRTPAGAVLALTAGERRLLQALFEHAPAVTPREALHDAPSGQATRLRSVDVLVSRLRRKAAEAGADLPVKCIRGKGYAFIGGVGR